MKRYHIGEIRTGAGTAWVHAQIQNKEIQVSYCATKEPGHKMTMDMVLEAIKFLLNSGHHTLIIEETS